MIPAGLDAKKRDEWMEPLGGMNRMTGVKTMLGCWDNR